MLSKEAKKQIKIILDSFLDLNEEQLMEITLKSLKEIFLHLEENFDDNSQTALFSALLVSILDADNKLTEKEIKLICNLFEYTKEELLHFYEITKKYDIENLANYFYDICPEHIKKAILMLCLSIMAFDKEINDYELLFFERLI